MTESALSLPNRRALEAIMNCSSQLYSTRSTVNDDWWVSKTNHIVTCICKRLVIAVIGAVDPRERRVQGIRVRSGGSCDSLVRSGLTRAGQALGWPRLKGLSFQGLISGDIGVMQRCLML